jgi:hypothetical protein
MILSEFMTVESLWAISTTVILPRKLSSTLDI